MGVRFTSWLSEDEAAALGEAARENGCSKNYVLRIIVRGVLLGKPMPLTLKPKERLTTK